jgi:hypothetical protein
VLHPMQPLLADTHHRWIRGASDGQYRAEIGVECAEHTAFATSKLEDLRIAISSGYSRFSSLRSGYKAAASTTLRTVKRIPRMQGCPFMMAGFIVMRSSLRAT